MLSLFIIRYITFSRAYLFGFLVPFSLQSTVSTFNRRVPDCLFVFGRKKMRLIANIFIRLRLCMGASVMPQIYANFLPRSLCFHKCASFRASLHGRSGRVKRFYFTCAPVDLSIRPSPNQNANESSP